MLLLPMLLLLLLLLRMLLLLLLLIIIIYRYYYYYHYYQHSIININIIRRGSWRHVILCVIVMHLFAYCRSCVIVFDFFSSFFEQSILSCRSVRRQPRRPSSRRTRRRSPGGGPGPATARPARRRSPGRGLNKDNSHNTE